MRRPVFAELVTLSDAATPTGKTMTPIKRRRRRQPKRKASAQGS
jgi:hypothetical protein